MTGNRFFERLMNVYSWLGDDISKEVFLARINYLITGNEAYIDALVRKYLPELPARNGKEIKDLLAAIPREEKIVLYGAGTDLEMNIGELKQDSRIVAICDADKEKQAKQLYGYPVISPENLTAACEYSVIITSHIALKAIRDYLAGRHYPEDKIYELAPYIFCADNGQYFSPEFMKYDTEGGEVFIDDGCCNLQSTLLLGKYCSNIRKVYAFEPDPENYLVCEREKEKQRMDRVDLLNKGTWSKTERLAFSATNDGSSHLTDKGDSYIDVVAIDDVVPPEETVSMIKMDVEGAELESLKGAESCIIKNKPKLAICIYHKAEDMLELPEYIKSIVPEYRLYLRHHSNMAGETVLYAVV